MDIREQQHGKAVYADAAELSSVLGAAISRNWPPQDTLRLELEGDALTATNRNGITEVIGRGDWGRMKWNELVEHCNSSDIKYAPSPGSH